MSDLSQRIKTLSPKQIALLAKRLEARGASGVPAITRSERRDQLSFAQRRLWFLHQLAPEEATYNIALAVKLMGALDVAALNRALSAIVERHEVLRTTFVAVDGEPIANIQPAAPINLPLIDLIDSEQPEQAAREMASDEAKLPFDLSSGALLRGRLLRLESNVHVLLLTMHHIVSDAWSSSVFFDELSELYNGYVAGAEVQLPESALQYVDYAIWQNENLNGAVEQQLSYWKKQLAGIPALLELPVDKPRPAIQTYRGSRTSFDLPQSLITPLKTLASGEGVTLFMTLLAAFQALLARYSGQQDIVVGAPVAGRSRAETDRLIGFFVNTLVLRTGVSGELSFRELLQQVKDVCLGAFANQDVSFERLVEELQPERSISHQVLFQVMFQLHTAPRDLPQLSGLRWEWFARESGEAVKFDLMLTLEESARGLSGTFAFNTDLFETSSVERMARHFVRLVQSVVAEPDRQLAQLSLLNDEERRQLLVEWNHTATEYPRERCIHELFTEQAALTPEAIAVAHEGQTITYAELNTRSNQLAHYLQHTGIGPETLVGVCMERSIEMVTALLGILKAGGVYVPLDPEYPQSRLNYILDEAATRIVLTHLPLAEMAGFPTSNPCSGVTSANQSYVIYTSGSTGRPKGVQIEHHSAIAMIDWAHRTFPAESFKGVLASTSICFDLSIFELFVPLSVGGTIVLAQNALQLAELENPVAVTMINTVPSAMSELLRMRAVPASVRVVNLAGEALSPRLAQDVYGLEQVESLYNLYGPSEDTTYSTWERVERAEEANVPIGRPVSNTRAYVVDEGLQLVPVGVSGELLLGGDGLARGYLKRAELTAERFIPDPFSRKPGERLYRTGDLCRYRSDGRLEYLGRLDHQVKVRGYRIELGEVELALASHPDVRDTVVLAREGENGVRNSLIGYVVWRDGQVLSAEELRTYLGERLPEYMVPSLFVTLSELPLSPNGKVDRRALPAPSEADLELSGYAEPATPVQEILAGIWREVLRLERVGIDDDFFALGGHSLKATQVMSRVRQACAVELPLRSLFTSSTVRELAREVEKYWASGTESAEVELKPVARDGELPLSFAQQRLWFLDQLEPDSAFYNVPLVIRLRGVLNVTALERSVNEIVKRHEVLRTRFPILDGQPLQVIDEAEPIALTALNVESEAAASMLQLKAQLPFDLATGPLLRVSLLRVADDEHLALFTLHHIVADAWSMGILTRELSTLYETYNRDATAESPLPDLRIQYADFAAWQRDWLQGERLEQQLAYWREQLAEAATLELPTDYVRPAVRSSQGKVYNFSLDRELSAALKKLSQQRGATLFMTLLAAWQLLLSRYSRQADVVVGTPIAGRTRRETESLIGFLVNTVVLRTDCGGDPTFIQLLERVREVCLGAYAHQEVPFEKLVEELETERDLSRTPLFQVLFTLQNAPREVLELSELQVSSVALEAETTKFDVSLTFTETEHGIKGGIEYRTDLYETATIERIASHLSLLLSSIAAEPDARVSQLNLLSDAERRQLLVEWNDTRRDYEADKCLHELFEEQVERTPDVPAFVYENQQLSYRELNERANQVAHYLRRLGVGPETLVALLMERSLELMVGMMGILKAGGAYVPIDPSYPAERIGLMLEPAPVLVTLQHLTAKLSQHSAQVVNLDSDWPMIATESTANPERRATASNLIYVIYTSGSTGKPKGVMIEHRSIPNILTMLEAYTYPTRLRVSINAPLVFDASVYQYVEFCAGHTIYIVPEHVHADGAALTSFLEQHEIEVFDCTPSHLRVLLECGLERNRSLKFVLVGGEAIDKALWDQLANNKTVTYHNDYGPTECTVSSTSIRITPASTPTIGRPLANVEIYLLDDQLGLVGVGMAGEVFIGGVGVGRGYLDRPELTAERFVPNPFTSAVGARLYRTGDLAKYQPDGKLVFLGRCDHQIKLRGFRIELGEIEAAVMSYPDVRECVVLLREDQPGDKRLVAYVVAATTVSSVELRSYLKGRLPEYMVPAVFMRLDKLPLLASDKVDRHALPKPSASDLELSERYAEASTPVQEIVAGIWREVLGLERVGIDDDFFALGGHSLKATQVMSRVRQACAVELPLRSLFTSSTVRELAREVESCWAYRNGGESVEIELKPVAREDELPLSFAQQRLWFLDQLEPNSALYNVPVVIRLRGTFNVTALERSVNEIVKRHEVLRTRFPRRDGQPVQVIDEDEPISLKVGTVDDDAASVLQREAQLPFDLVAGPLLRVNLLRVADDEHLALFTLHHIVTDGWSMGILTRELSTLYETFNRDPEAESPLPELPIQYADFAAWQREWLQGERLEQQLAYWREQLAEAATLELPTDYVRPAVLSTEGKIYSFSLDRELSVQLKQLSQQRGVTLFMTLLAAWQLLLSRYSRQNDIVVGTPIAGRTRRETESLIGFFVNTVVLRTDCGGDLSFVALLERVREVCLGAYAHQEVPFEKLVEELETERDVSRTPLFQVAFALQNAPQEVLELSELQISSVALEGETTKFDVSLTFTETEHGLKGGIEYRTDLFETATIERMASQLSLLLQSVVKEPEARISHLTLLSDAERRQLLVEWNDTRREYEASKCLHELFEAQAERTPEVTALVYEDRQYSYRELNERSNQLAHYLLRQGVGPEVLVGLLMERSLDLVVGVMGILKAGGAYVPIDPQLPAERIAYMVHDAGIRVAVTEQPRSDIDVDWVDIHSPEIASCSTENLNVDVASDNLAYVMYTSGSTGAPKGVSVSHRAVIRLVKETNYADLDEKQVFLQLATVSFDASTFELWGSLLNGARLVIMPPETPSLAELGAVLEAHKVTILFLTTQLFHLMVDERLEDLRGVRQLLMGGDVGSIDHVERYLAAAGERVLIHCYGPTENTTFSTTCPLNTGWRARGNSVPIGGPIANSQVYVLDEAMEPSPVGVPGELYVAGDGLARDYLGRPELTAEKFVPHPHSAMAGARMYRTGDQVRWLADGNLEFLGRIDQQVKIRGFRVELGEIEAALNEHESVREALVIAPRKEIGERQLVAYFVGGNVTGGELREYLKGRLPKYMVPSVFVALDELPLMTNGKIDRRALPAPSTADLELSGYIEPATPVQEILAGIWREVLRLERVGIDDDFFTLGGHSLRATQVMSRLRQTCAVELPLRSLFLSPTVRELAREVESCWATGSESTEVALTPVAHDGELPLSFAQQRLWFLDQLEPNSAFYNVPVVIRLRGTFNVTALERSVNEIVRRHEVLRTRFPRRAPMHNGQPVQVIDEAEPLTLTVVTIDDDAASVLQREAQLPFDLAAGPLVRVNLLRVADDEHLALFTLHHIVTDGWSMGILTRELSTLYETYNRDPEAESPLSELPIQYADFAAWQREWLQGERLEQQLAYWREQLAEAAILELPTDYARPAVLSTEGKIYSFSLDRELSVQLKQLSQQRGVTLFMTLLAAWQLLLSRYSRQSDVVVGTPIAGRTRRETESLIGFFVNTVVLRTDCGGDLSFVALLERVREVCLGAYAHQEVPFEKLVEELGTERDVSRTPLFQVLFALQNAPQEVLELSELQISSVALEAETTKFDVALTVTETDRGLKGSVEYRTDLFETATIERMAEHLRLLLSSIATEPETRVSQLTLLSDAERRQLLVEWNDTRREYEADKCLHELFEAQAERTPEVAAVVYEDARLSYRELNERSNQLAHYLRRQGVKPETLVGLLMERSLDLVVGVMGILKAGGAYVPIDPSYPAERTNLMLEPVSVLLTQEHFNREWSTIAAESTRNPEHQTTSQNIAYVIYTSGSTGQPKGVMIEHRSIPNLLAGLDDLVYDQHQPPLRVTVNAPLVFDASVKQLIALGAGHTLYPIPEAVRTDPGAFTEYLERHQINVLDCTPSHLRMLLERGLNRNTALKFILVGGEALDPLWSELANNETIACYNLYGPTECTVDTVGCRVTNDTQPTIGKPLANVEVYVLDEHLNPAGTGMVGELYHGGAGLGRGYLNRPELTAERYIPHPFSHEPGARLYRTGDLVKYLPDGSLMFLGRCDHQVKLRGHRLELGEIQSLLMTHPAVRDAAVLLQEGTETLAAYVVVEDGSTDAKELRQYLRDRVPDYMVPSAIMELDQLPLTRNGKLDRSRLPAPGFDLQQETFVAPRTPTEESLAQIWSEVLNVERIGVNDNFFDLGGHSLLATQIFSRMQDVFGVELPLRALFEAPTVAGLAEKVDAYGVKDVCAAAG